MSRQRERLTVRRTDDVSEAATVRHVDQLSEEALTAVVEMTDGESRRVAGVESGDVVVFTSYLEVVPAERGRGTERRGTAGSAGTDDRRVDTGPVG